MDEDQTNNPGRALARPGISGPSSPASTPARTPSRSRLSAIAPAGTTPAF